MLLLGFWVCAFEVEYSWRCLQMHCLHIDFHEVEWLWSRFEWWDLSVRREPVELDGRALQGPGHGRRKCRLFRGQKGLVPIVLLRTTEVHYIWARFGTTQAVP